MIMKKLNLLFVLILVSLYCFGQEEKKDRKEEKGITVEVPQISESNLIPAKSIDSVKSTSSRGSYDKFEQQGSMEGIIIDSTHVSSFIPADTSYSLKYNSTSKLLENLPPFLNITDTAKIAINKSPDWMGNDLFDIFRRIDTNLQNAFAQEIISADSLYRDEVAFQIAHLSLQTLGMMSPGLPLENAKAMYTIEPDLQYVEFVEHDNSPDGWYTTTKYRVVDSIGDTVWTEIPRNVYYWWVVMPKLSDEEPRNDASVYGEFWRSYVYNNSDQDYPLLREKLSNIKILWDGEAHRWDNKDSVDQPVPFHDSLMAVAVVGRWVAHTLPDKANPPRPVQPNKLLHDHDGNCGELEDLLSAGARAALYPIYSVGTWPGDHVWGETYWPITKEWTYYQVSWDCGPTLLKWDKEYSDKACIAGWRADGYRWMVDDHYSDEFTFNVEVNDKNGNPVDGAEIFFFSPSVHSGDYTLGSWGHTNENGVLSVKLNANASYGYRADWEDGHNPSSSNSIKTISKSSYSAGDTIYETINAGGAIPQTNVNSSNDTTSGNYSLRVEYQQLYQTLYGGGYWQFNFDLDNYEYAKKIQRPGKVDYFLTNPEKFDKYQNDTSFQAFNLLEKTPFDTSPVELPNDENFFVTLSNDEMNTISQFSEFTAYLIERSASDDITIDVYPNPFSSQATFSCTFTEIPEKYSLKIYNIQGKKIKDLAFGQPSSFTVKHSWSGKDNTGEQVSNGIYFVRLKAGDETVTKKIISLRKQ